MILGYLDDLIEKEIMRRIVRYNKEVVICFTWLFSGLVVLDLSLNRDVEFHNSLRRMYDDKGAGMRYFYKGEELK
jgi:hypothetical protein